MNWGLLFWILDAMIKIVIHKIKTGFYRQNDQENASKSLEIGLPVPLSSNSPGLQLF